MSDTMLDGSESMDVESHTINEREAACRELALQVLDQYRSGDVTKQIASLSQAIDRTRDEYYRLKEERNKFAEIDTKGLQIAMAVALAVPNASKALLFSALEEAFGKTSDTAAGGVEHKTASLSHAVAAPKNGGKSRPSAASRNRLEDLDDPKIILAALDKPGMSMGSLIAKLGLVNDPTVSNKLRAILQNLAADGQLRISGLKNGTRYHAA